MNQRTGKFAISHVDLGIKSRVVEQDSIYLGRLDTCNIVLNHKTVSRIHAGINFADSRYVLSNLSSSNALTLNGRLLRPQKSDVLADGDTIQMGPFTISVGRPGNELVLVVETQFADASITPPMHSTEAPVEPSVPEPDGVLKLFWEKRSREKDDWGTRLRPTHKPLPGKSIFNWRPTADLRRRWRSGLFLWSILLIGAMGGFAYFRFPNTYAPKPLSRVHSEDVNDSTIAALPSRNSCTTCHTPNEPLENSCVRCHQADQFHPTNTKAHEESGVTCMVCHKEHQGPNFDLRATAIQSCAQCHNNNNNATYNGRKVATPHDGTYGYPLSGGLWKWKGVYREIAEAIPEIRSSATGDKNEQARLNRYFHTIHVARLKVPDGVRGDSQGLVSCSTCHESFDPIDRNTPKQTCSACHTTAAEATDRDKRFPSNGSANCISCHVQHPYSGGRWSDFVTPDALKRRQDAIGNKSREIKVQ
jgi:hypothetical protein